MKPLKFAFATVLMSSLLAGSAFALACPYQAKTGSYGTGCSIVAIDAPKIDAGFDGSGNCSVKFAYSVPPACCNVFLTQQLLIIGFNQVKIPAPSGCTLLASPDIIVPLVPTVGTTTFGGDLPPNPALIGTSVFFQGVVERFTTIGLTHDYEFSAGLQMKFG